MMQMKINNAEHAREMLVWLDVRKCCWRRAEKIFDWIPDDPILLIGIDDDEDENRVTPLSIAYCMTQDDPSEMKSCIDERVWKLKASKILKKARHEENK